MAPKARAAALIVAALVFQPTAAAAQGTPTEDDSPAIALAAGAGITFVSLGVGATLVARGENQFVKNTGLIGGQSGMVLAPFVAHAIVGETKRGVYFALPLLVPIAVNSVLTGLYPSIIKRAPAGVQYATFISVTLSIFGSTIGVLDAVRAFERRAKRNAASSVVIAPLFGDGMAGAFVAGSL